MLSIKSLNFKYNQEKIFNDFNFEVEKGEVVAIVGPSGYGKTTLLRIISGLEKAESGEIKIDGEVVFDEKTNRHPHDRKVGLVFQDYALFPHLTAKDNVGFGLDKSDLAKKKVSKMMELLEIEDLKDKYPHQLSGGQQQRVAIARSLVLDPKLLLLDEVFSNLDQELVEVVVKLMRDCFAYHITTVVFVTHDMNVAKKLGHRVVDIRELT